MPEAPPSPGPATWSAARYLAFEAERTRPVRDLLAAALPGREVRRAVDLGCGPGNSTEALVARFPHARVTGIDSSPDMVEAARRRLPQVRFEQASIEAWDDRGPFDVILANAVLQWLPDQAAVLTRLVSRLGPGGVLAVQTPDNLDEPAHRLMREVAADPRWADRLAPAVAERAPRHDAAWLHGVLGPLCTRVDVWRTTYFHPLAGPDAVVDWFRGSALRPYLARLDAAEGRAFLARYRAALTGAYPPLPTGGVLLPFPRLFLVATR